MKYQRSVWHSGADFLQAIKVEFDVAFVESMSGADRNSESVYVCFSHKLCGIVCFSQEFRCCRVGSSVLSDVAQLAFNRHTGGVCELNHAPGHRTIIVE